MASTIQWHWQYRKQSLALCVSKPKTTRSAFATQEATPGDEDKPSAPTETKASKKTKKKGNKKQKWINKKSSASSAPNIAAAVTTSEASTTNPSKRTKQYHCTACRGDRHTYDWCYFVLGEDGDKDWLDRETFDNNMKVPFFKKKVEKYRSALKTVAEAKTEAKTD